MCLWKREAKDKIEETAHQIRNLMLKFKQLQEEQQKYYLTILKEGTDTRKEGLTWVIEALLEIQSEPSNGDFPFFLNQEQIDYLMLMAKLSLEKKQIKAMIPALLHRRRRQFEEIDELKKRITTIQDKMFELMMQEFRRYVDKYGHNNEKENTVIKNANKNRNNPIDKEAYGWYNVIYMTIRMFRR